MKHDFMVTFVYTKGSIGKVVVEQVKTAKGAEASVKRNFKVKEILSVHVA